MRTIFKYEMPDPGQVSHMSLPAQPAICMVGMQDGRIMMWAQVETDSDVEMYDFCTIGTGRNVPDGFHHIGSVIDGAFVWHVYARQKYSMARRTL